MCLIGCRHTRALNGAGGGAFTQGARGMARYGAIAAHGGDAELGVWARG